MPLGRGAVATLEQVIAAKGFEHILFLAVVAFQHSKYGRLQVIIRDSPWHTPKEIASLDVALEEGFLLLERKGHHEPGFRVVQPHHEYLHHHPHPANLRLRFSPIYLGILSRLKLQGQKCRTMFLGFLPLADVVMNSTLAPAVPCFLDQQEDFVGRVALFTRQSLALFQ